MQLSVTQLETAELCIRKWWNQYVDKLPVPQMKPQTFGTVLHAIADRFLSADALGRDMNGQPVELYPPGWTHAANRFTGESEGEVTPAEQDIIKQLVDQAITSGVLQRASGESMVEFEFLVPLIDDIKVKGLIDYLYPHTVEDHKSTSSMRWAKSPRKLRESIQMMLYAGIYLEGFGPEERVPAQITLRHNAFCKDQDDLRVRKTEVQVTAKEVDDFKANHIVPLALKMKALKETAKSWSDCPDPPNFAHACNAYGGCPFRGICSNPQQETVAEYRRRMASPVLTIPTVKGKTMGLADRMKELSARNNPAAGSPVAINPPTSAQPAAVAPQPILPAAPTQTAAPSEAAVLPANAEGDIFTGPPPWANPNCFACKGCGFATDGTACRICDIAAGKSGKTRSADYKITLMGQGECHWAHKQDAAVEGISAMPTKGAPVKAEEKAAAPAPTPVPIQAATATTTTNDMPTVMAATQIEQAKRGRPAGAKNKATTSTDLPVGPLATVTNGFTLILNAVVSKGTSTNLLTTFDGLITQMEAATKQNYRNMDAFKRRDEMAKVARDVAGELQGLVFADLANGTPDFKAFVEAIRPLAAVEIVGTV